MNKKGEVATAGIIVIAFCVGLFIRAAVTKELKVPDFKANPKTIDKAITGNGGDFVKGYMK